LIHQSEKAYTDGDDNNNNNNNNNNNTVDYIRTYTGFTDWENKSEHIIDNSSSLDP
jgi:hypothetical protein